MVLERTRTKGAPPSLGARAGACRAPWAGIFSSSDDRVRDRDVSAGLPATGEDAERGGEAEGEEEEVEVEVEGEGGPKGEAVGAEEVVGEEGGRILSNPWCPCPCP